MITLRSFIFCFLSYSSWVSSGPDAALAALVKDGSGSTVPDVVDTAGTHVEAALIIGVGIQAVGFSIAEAGAWGVSGRSGGGGSG